jgi:hypothetical protein
MEVAAKAGRRTRGNGMFSSLVGIALFGLSGTCLAQEPAKVHQVAEQSKSVDSVEISAWLGGRFSRSELEAMPAADLKVESYHCGCYDQPVQHFPYAMVVVNTAKGDWIGRPEGGDEGVRFTGIAERFGDRYCDVGPEGRCYGSFAHPCDFSDFRFGANLRTFFPTCKANQSESTSSGAPR